MTWVEYASPVYWVTSVFMINEFDGLTFTCDPSERLPSGRCPIQYGSEILSLFGFDPVNLTGKVLLAVGISVSFRFLAFIPLWLRRRNSLD